MSDPDQVHDHKHSEYENDFSDIYYHEGFMVSIGDKIGMFDCRFNTWIIFKETKKVVQIILRLCTHTHTF